MKGDFTRSTFRSDKHYSSVRMQQGRLQVDADWNEQADINAHLREAQALDMLVAEPAAQAAEALLLRGSSENRATMAAAPRTRPEGDSADVFENFRLVPKEKADDIAIAPGHIYIDGILCELTKPLTYLNQLDYPDAKAADLNGDGKYLAYLDVWQRHVTAIDDIEIRERALTSVPDTATRVKTVWQVKLQKLETEETLSLDGAIAKLKDPEKGQLTVAESEQSDGFGQSSMAEGGRSLGNSLYRVEIHDPGPYGIATFKWSKNNGIVVAKISTISNNTITIDNLAPDEVNRFSAGDWVEVTDTAHELRGEPGLLLRLSDRTTNSKLVFDPATLISAKANPVLLDSFEQGNTQNIFKVRRWEEVALSTGDAKLPMTLDGSSVQIQFKADKKVKDGDVREDEVQEDEESKHFYNTGDYWLIPMRSGRPDLPQLQGKASADLLPEGIRHSKAPLALLEYKEPADDTQPHQFSLIKTQSEEDRSDESDAKGDYRLTFPALTRCLDSFGGVIQGSFEVQKNLLVTQSRDENNELVYGRLGVGTYDPTARVHIKLDGKTVGQVIQGDEGKKENLQEWREFDLSKEALAVVSPEGHFGVGTPTPGASVHVQVDRSDRVGQIIQAAAGQTEDLQQWRGLGSHNTVISANGHLGLGVDEPDSPLAMRGQIKLFDSDEDRLNSQSFRGAIAFDNQTLNITANTVGEPLTLALSQGEKQFNFSGGMLRVEESVPEGETQCLISGKLAAEALAIGSSTTITQVTTGDLTDSEVALPTDKAVKAYVDGEVESLNSALQEEKDSTVERFTETNQAVSDNGEAIAELQKEKESVTLRFGEVNRAIAANTTSITGLREAEASRDQRLGDIDTAIESNATAIKDLSEDVVATLRTDLERVTDELNSTEPASIRGVLSNVQSTFTSTLLKKSNLNGSSGHDFNVKNLIAKNNILLQSNTASDTDLNTAARLQVQGLGESPFTVLGTVLASRNEIATSEPLSAGDSITLSSGETKLVTAVEADNNADPARKVTLSPPFPQPTTDDDRRDNETISYRRQSPIARFTDNSGTDQFTLTAKGNVVIGPLAKDNPPATDAKLHINGKVFGVEVITQSMAQLSSQTLKENISDLSTEEATVLLGQLDPVKFSYRTDENHAIRTGFIAETVPDVVATADHQGVSPLDITAILTKVTKDHHLTLARMTDLIQQQQAEIRSLNEKVARLSQ